MPEAPGRSGGMGRVALMSKITKVVTDTAAQLECPGVEPWAIAGINVIIRIPESITADKHQVIVERIQDALRDEVDAQLTVGVKNV